MVLVCDYRYNDFASDVIIVALIRAFLTPVGMTATIITQWRVSEWVNATQ